MPPKKSKKFSLPFNRSNPYEDWKIVQNGGETHLMQSQLHPLAFGKENPDPKALYKMNKELYKESPSHNSAYSSHDTADARTFSPESAVYSGDQVRQSYIDDENENEINKRIEKARKRLKGLNSEER